MGDSYIAPGANYMLPADEGERKRLDDQHIWLRNEVYDGRLIYDQSVDVPNDGWILDAGTGSGVWIMALSSKMPQTVQMHGIDVSTKLFPTDHPSNVSFKKGSVTILPAEWSGRFDFVNQRLLIAALRVPEWPMAIGEIFRVLKPGGHVQLCEAYLGRDATTVVNRKLLQVITAAMGAQGLHLEPIEDVPGMLEKAGFVDIQAVERKMHIGVEGRRSFGGAFRGMVRSVMAHGGFGLVHSEQEFHDLLDTADAEWDRGISNVFSYGLVVARKPL